MNTQQQNLDLNWKVAEALGWTELFRVGGSIVGCPPGGSPNSRNQAMVPNWSGDFNLCCELGLSYNIYPHRSEVEFRMRNEKIDRSTAFRHVMLFSVLSSRSISLK